MSAPILPTELLYPIIALLTVEYIDDVIAGPLKLPPLPILDQVDPERELRDDEDPARTAPNPVLPLFYISCEFRATLLKILSSALDIPLSPISANARIDRYAALHLTIKPWCCIQPIRMLTFKVCSVNVATLDGGPLLKPYLMLALINLSYDYFELISRIGRPSEISSHIGRILSRFNLAKRLEETINPAILRTSLSPRLRDAGTRLGSFVCIRVLLPLLSDAFEQFKRFTSGPQHSDKTGLRQRVVASLLSQLSLVKTLRELLVQVGFLNDTNRSEVTPISESLDIILKFEDMPGTDLYKCKQLALDLRESFSPTMPPRASTSGENISQGNAENASTSGCLPAADSG